MNDYGGDAKLFKDRCLTPLDQLSEVYGHLYMSYVYGGRRREEITSVHRGRSRSPSRFERRLNQTVPLPVFPGQAD